MKSSILGRAFDKHVFSYSVVNPRDFATDTHKSVDDHPYGGGAGMVMRADILEKALLHSFKMAEISPEFYDRSKHLVVVMSAAGELYTQKRAQEFTTVETIFLICGHYEGIDERFIEMYCDVQLSIGAYVLTGGEVPALAVADSVIRLLPGALGDARSFEEESYSLMHDEELLVEYPHYTRPSVFNDVSVPEILMSGNHAAIAAWRLEQARLRTVRLKKKAS